MTQIVFDGQSLAALALLRCLSAYSLHQLVSHMVKCRAVTKQLLLKHITQENKVIPIIIIIIIVGKRNPPGKTCARSCYRYLEKSGIVLCNISEIGESETQLVGRKDVN